MNILKAIKNKLFKPTPTPPKPMSLPDRNRKEEEDSFKSSELQQLRMAARSLMENPDEFLMHHFIHIGCSGDSRRVGTVYMYFNGNTSKDNTSKNGKYCFKISTYAPGPGKAYVDLGAAHIVAMHGRSGAVKSYDVEKIKGYTLPDDGANLMITGQLTGCCFCVGKTKDGKIIAAHLQPGAEKGGASNLLDGVTGKGKFEGDIKILAKYGKGSDTNPGSYGGNASIFGIRKGDEWKLYGQNFTNVQAAENLPEVGKSFYKG